MKRIFLTLITLIIFQSSLIICGHSAEEWKKRAIYQILTDRWARNEEDKSECDLHKYCGGNFKSIINHLNYIKNLGFDAIWISPIVENTEGDYHGYAFTNLYKINPHFGTEEDLKELVRECHKLDIWVMVDVVGNHCGCVNEDFSRVTPFNKAEYYHDKCEITDWNDQYMVENCRLSCLPDLKQEDNWVAQTLYDWIKDIIKKFDFDGMRVDTVPEVPKWFWDKFTESSGVFSLGEVFNARPGYVGGYQGHLDGLLNYPLYYSMNEAFCNYNNIQPDLRKIEDYIINKRIYLPDPTLFGVFLENHDNKRFLNFCNNKISFKNAIAFSLTWEGIPILYYGGEQFFSGGDDPLNREPFWGHFNETSEMFIMIKKINELRKNFNYYKYEIVQRFADQWFYSFSRGEMLVAVGTLNYIKRIISKHPFKIGDTICNIFDINDCINITNDGLIIELNGDPKIYVKKSTLDFI